MDGKSMAIATIVGAVIGATGTIAAAYVNLLKPSEKQVERSEHYVELEAEAKSQRQRVSQLEEALHRLQSEGAQSKVTTLEAANATLRAENAQLRTRVSALEGDNKRLSETSRVVPGSPITGKAVEPEPKPAPATAQLPQRTQYFVKLGAVTRVPGGPTISMSALRTYGFNRLGANFYVDGKSGPTRYAGQRISVNVDGQKCYFDVLALEGSDKAPDSAKATVEYACEQGGR